MIKSTMGNLSYQNNPNESYTEEKLSMKLVVIL